MHPRVLVSLFSLLVSFILTVISIFVFKKLDAKELLLQFFISFIVCFFIFYYLIERIIFKKIKLVYKLIYNLKMDKELKSAIGEYVTDDPLNDVEKEVKDWARDKKKEIEELQKMANYRKEFLANISHEFKTPLFSIQGYINSLIDDNLEDKEHVKKFLQKTDKNIERLIVLVNDLDEISKLESGQVELNFTQFNIYPLIKEVAEQFAEKAKSLNIKIVTSKNDLSKTTVSGDIHKIRQVLINLIDNALKYGKSGGLIELELFEMDDRILVEVTDDGIGIAEKHLNRVFERFYRTDASRSRKIGGSGLGLAIVKHIIEAHKQTINVRSTEGVGTTFAFTLAKAKKK